MKPLGSVSTTSYWPIDRLLNPKRPSAPLRTVASTVAPCLSETRTSASPPSPESWLWLRLRSCQTTPRIAPACGVGDAVCVGVAVGVAVAVAVGVRVGVAVAVGVAVGVGVVVGVDDGVGVGVDRG